jgi:hypothetical protein
MVFLIDEVIMENVFNTGVNPVHSGIYIVDRGEKLGTPLRWFNADTGVWSRCEYTMEDILQSKDKPSGLGFLPWRGPVKVAAKKPVTEVALVDTTGVQVKVKAEKQPLKAPKVQATKSPSPRGKKSKYPAYNIWFLEDKQVYVGTNGDGKREVYRHTVELCLRFLKKKYKVDAILVEKEPAKIAI